jgi:hypothetical protein
MTTIMGPTPCRDCKAPVSVVTRTAEVPCDGDLEVPIALDSRGWAVGWTTAFAHHHALPDVAWTVVDADGERHLCPVDTARYDAGSEEASGQAAPINA